jgi:hypothetical protein
MLVRATPSWAAAVATAVATVAGSRSPGIVRPERYVSALRCPRWRGFLTGDAMRPDSARVELSSSYDDDRLYRQALVLHEVFDESGVSPRMEAVLDRMRRGRRPLRDAA